jgi:hypothetical protein
MKIQKNIAISDSGLLFNPATGESFSVNPIGLEIINLMRQGKNDEEISKVIVANYSIELPVIERDLHDFIHLMNQYQLADSNGGENN